MDGLKRLESQVIALDDSNISAIFEYLKTRVDLYDNFNNEEKSIKGMYDFICSKAKSHKVNNVAIVSDKVVYLWAVNYFVKTNQELGIIEDTSTKVSSMKVNKEVTTSSKKEVEDNQISIFQEDKD